MIKLAGLEPSPKAQAHLYWRPQTREGYLVTSDLPELKHKKVYELWLIAEGRAPVPAGIFSANRGTALHRLPELPGDGSAFTTFAVTAEPAGGTPAPTGPMYLMGKTVLDTGTRFYFI